MAKYTYEFKKKVVNDYFNGRGGYGFLAKTYGIPSKIDVEKWVHNYQVFGDDGLRRSRKKENYSFQKKLFVVELYLSSEISYQDLALQEGIKNPTIIAEWVRRFRIAGPDALRPRKKGRKEIVDKSIKKNVKNKQVKDSTIDTSIEQ